jgi:hypothetical protein
MDNFLYQSKVIPPNKYTLDDLNNAIDYDGNEGSTAIGGDNVWGSLANATKTGNTSEM